MTAKATRCACGNPLPPYAGRGRPPSKCDACKHRRRQCGRRHYERQRYADDPAFRERKRADSRRQARARRAEP